MTKLKMVKGKTVHPKYFTDEQRKLVFQTICDGIADGLSQNEAIKRQDSVVDEKGNELLMPTRRSFYRWQGKYEELYKIAQAAWDSFIIAKIDEIEELSKYGPEIPDDANANDIRNLHNLARLRIDTLKFQIAKVATMMSKRFKPEVKATQGKDGELSIVIQNFSTDS